MKELKKVKVRGKFYYLDERLKQLRNVKNPHDFINLNDFEVRYFVTKTRVNFD